VTQSDNDQTLQAYNDHIQEYVAANNPVLQGSLKAWVDEVLKLIPKGGRVLELGSGYGRDAAYIESQGYAIERTDAAEGFVELLKNQGHDARKLNVLTDDFGTNFDLIYAQAVFLHFNPEQLKQVLKKSFDSLKQSGTLAFSVKEGEGEAWPDDYLGVPRYYCYWKEPALQKITEATGFSSIEITKRQGIRDLWLHVIAKK
jgi:predicted TPR repeat methyltransferase